MRTTIAWLLALTLPLLVVPISVPPALAGYVVVDENGDRTLISKGRIKTVPRKGQEAFVLDVGRARLWLTNPESRQYWEGTVDEFCAGLRKTIGTAVAGMQGEMAEQMKTMQREMAKMSPAERQQMEQMMKMMERMGAQGGAQTKAPPAPAKPRRVTVQATGETATIAGLPTRKYSVLADGRPYEDLWLTPDPGIAGEMALDRMPDTFGRMIACLAGAGKSAAGADDSVESSPEYLKLYRAGWPLKTVSYEDHEGKPVRGEPKTFAATIERRDIPESEFAPPRGYRRASLEEMLGAR
jgi:hypothetical protein